jgi:hypothetical protein
MIDPKEALKRLFEKVDEIKGSAASIEADMADLVPKLAAAEKKRAEAQELVAMAQKELAESDSAVRALEAKKAELLSKEGELAQMSMNLELALQGKPCEPQVIRGGGKTTYPTAKEICDALRAGNQISPYSAIRAAMGDELMSKDQIFEEAKKFGYVRGLEDLAKALYNNKVMFVAHAAPEGSSKHKGKQASWFKVQDTFVVLIPEDIRAICEERYAKTLPPESPPEPATSNEAFGALINGG